MTQSTIGRVLHSRYALVFSVPGTAKPKGTLVSGVRKDGIRFQRNLDKGHGEWRARVTFAARDAMRDWPLFDGPVRIELTFFRPRPKGHLNAKGEVKPRFADALPSSKPDLDKLMRSVGDSLNGVVYVDDQQITSATILKRWGAAGVHVHVESDRIDTEAT